MSEETKMILEQLGKISENMLEMKEDIAGLKADVSGLKGDMSGVKVDVSSLKADMENVKGRLTNLEEGQKNLHLLIENELSKKINIVAEGHFFVMKNLQELRGFQEEKEMMDLKILDLQMEVKKIKNHLKIA